MNEIEELDSEAYEIMNNSFLKESKQKDVVNFLFFHGVRNLKLTTCKIIDSFKQAKSKQLNPIVAKQLKLFIEPYIKFLVFLKLVHRKGISGSFISEEIEKFRDIAKKTSFLCSTEEELKYDNIDQNEFKKLFKSIRDNL